MPPGPRDSDPSLAKTISPLDVTAPATSFAGGAATVASSDGEAQVDVGGTTLEEQGFEGRYTERALLGQGGMGEVRLCKDRRIGREVALKVILPKQVSRAEVQRRFLREARVQGQLEHPSIVPVYDLGIGPDGEMYFTMKRVRGMTLDAILDGLRAGEPVITASYSRRKLLSQFVNVCLAIDYAHCRGVLHRDLKPANLMLGNFGEVYVLDWGLAKFVGVADEDDSEPVSELPAVGGLETVAGRVFGTPGYIPPEQLEGKPVDRRSDVYALGTIFFEILARERLHTGPAYEAMITSTVRGVDARPSVRAPDAEIPPELDAICMRATAVRPEDRFASARDLSLAIERFLDGDRDQELRHELAREHAQAAERHAAAAFAPGAAAKSARARAMREVSRALALDPTDQDAMATLVRLLTEPPTEMPAEAAAELERSTVEQDRAAARGAVALYVGSLIMYALFVFWMGGREPLWGALGSAGLVLAAALSWLDSKGTGSKLEFWVLGATVVAMLACSRMLGPFVLLPTFAFGNTIGFALTPRRRRRALFIAVGCLSVLLPAVLEWVDVLPDSYVFSGGTLSIVPQMHDLPKVPTLLAMLVITVVSMLGASMFVGEMRDALAAAETRLHLHTWQLRQLLPQEGRESRTSIAVSRPG